MRILTMRLPYSSLVLLCAFWQCFGSTTTEKLEMFTAEYENQNLSAEPPVRSITDLVLQQTETIKKIIAEQQAPNIAKENSKETNEEQTEQKPEFDSIEELKKKCQHLSKLFNMQMPLTPQAEQFKDENPRNDNGLNYVYTPADLLAFKPKFPSPPAANIPKPPPQMAGNYFIFTQNPEIYGPPQKHTDKMDTAASSVEEDIVYPPSEEEQEQEDDDYENETTTTTSKPEEIASTTIGTTTTTTTTVAPATVATTVALPLPKFKYVRLEPIVLKQIALPNGKITRQWYRLLPTTQSFVQIPDTPANEEVTVVAQPQKYDASVSLPDQYKIYVDPNTGVIKANAQPPAAAATIDVTTTTTTTEKPPPQPPQQPQFFINPQTGMIYQSALPHQFIYHTRNKLPASPSPPPTTTTTTTTTEKIPDPTYTIDIPHKPENEPQPVEVKKQFKHEFRFVIPMVVQGTQDDLSKYPYQIDPYAYLPKGQRPETMNIPVPYVPNYQMIRKLMMPHKQTTIEE